MNVVSLLGNIAKVVTTVKSMAKVDEDGTLGIVTSAAEAATAVDVAKLQKEQIATKADTHLRLLRERESIVNGDYPYEDLSEDKQNKKLARIDKMLDENREVDPMEVDDATRDALTEANKEKVEPPILAGLAPFTAMIGIPIFLIGLMKYLGPAGAAFNADAAVTVDSSDATTPKYVEWGVPPDKKGRIKKKNSRGKKEKWWWTVSPLLPKTATKGSPNWDYEGLTDSQLKSLSKWDGDWTRQQFGGLGSKEAHERLISDIESIVYGLAKRGPASVFGMTHSQRPDLWAEEMTDSLLSWYRNPPDRGIWGVPLDL